LLDVTLVNVANPAVIVLKPETPETSKDPSVDIPE
jgi:hypothetical protein